MTTWIPSILNFKKDKHVDKKEEMRTALIKIYEMQDEFDSSVFRKINGFDGDWRDEDWDHSQAIQNEIREAIEHVGYEWWKHKTPNLEQAFIELIDALHFTIAADMKVASTRTPLQVAINTFDVVEAMLNDPSVGDFYDHITEEDIVEELSRFSKVVSAFSDGILDSRVVVAELFYVAKIFGKGFMDVIDGYIQKNALNQFRRDHGYKEGTYTKIWDGDEDNVVLARIVEQNPDKRLDIDFLYAKLSEIYSTIGLK